MKSLFFKIFFLFLIIFSTNSFCMEYKDSVDELNKKFGKMHIQKTKTWKFRQCNLDTAELVSFIKYVNKNKYNQHPIETTNSAIKNIKAHKENFEKIIEYIIKKDPKILCHYKRNNKQILHLGNTKLNTLELIILLKHIQKKYPKDILQLKEIHLDYNNLIAIPNCILRFKNLKRIHAMKNKIKYLPNNIDQLPNLEYLYLDQNEIEILPDSICKLTSLKSLVVSNNKLTYIPDGITNLTNLRYLNLHNNLLQKLPLTLIEYLKFQGKKLHPWKLESQQIEIKFLKAKQEKQDFKSWCLLEAHLHTLRPKDCPLYQITLIGNNKLPKNYRVNCRLKQETEKFLIELSQE